MRKLLLVEGYSDVEFFKKFCEYHSFDVDNIQDIEIAVSKDINDSFYNTKGGIINKALDDLLSQVKLGKIEKLGVIVDADFKKYGTGFAKTHQKIAEKLLEHNYFLAPNSNIAINQSDDILPNIGVWIMPNHCDDGAFEHWIKENIHQDEHAFYAYIENIVDIIEKPKFRPLQQLKVKIGTWLLWQQEPNLGTGNLFKPKIDNLIDRNGSSYQELLKWFENVFGD